MFADVAVPLPLFRTFTYSVPLTAKSLRPGCRVVVPFRNSHLVGVAVRVHKDPPSRKVKPISKVLDEEPLFSDKLLKLGLWVTAYYLAPSWRGATHHAASQTAEQEDFQGRK